MWARFVSRTITSFVKYIYGIYRNKPDTRGQASNGIQEHYADRWVSEPVSQSVSDQTEGRCMYKLPFNFQA